MEHKELYLNGCGYPDPTAYEAIRRIEEERAKPVDPDYEKYQKLIGCIFRICELSDFHLEERIVLKDKRTGKIYR